MLLWLLRVRIIICDCLERFCSAIGVDRAAYNRLMQLVERCRDSVDVGQNARADAVPAFALVSIQCSKGYGEGVKTGAIGVALRRRPIVDATAIVIFDVPVDMVVLRS